MPVKLSALLLLLITAISCTDRAHENMLVRKCFNDYVTAATNNLGSESIKYLDSATFNYYNSLIPVIINADSVTVQALRFDQQILVLIMRHTTPLSKIKQMNGRTLFEYLVQTGQCSSVNDLEKYSFDVRIKGGNKAFMQFIDSNNVKGITVQFNKENGDWKLNIPSLTAMLGKGTWELMEEKTGMTRPELINAVLKLSNDREPDNSIWHPMTKGK